MNKPSPFLTFILMAFMALVSGVSLATTVTSETAAFYRDGSDLTLSPRSPNYVVRQLLASTATSYTISVPTWASSATPGKGGVVTFSSIGGNVGVCVSSANASRCTSPTLPWPSTSGSTTDGTAYDANPVSYWLEPIAGAKCTSITFITDTSNTNVFAKFYKSKGY